MRAQEKVQLRAEQMLDANEEDNNVGATADALIASLIDEDDDDDDDDDEYDASNSSRADTYTISVFMYNIYI